MKTDSKLRKKLHEDALAQTKAAKTKSEEICHTIRELSDLTIFRKNDKIKAMEEYAVLKVQKAQATPDVGGLLPLESDEEMEKIMYGTLRRRRPRLYEDEFYFYKMGWFALVQYMRNNK